MLANVTAATVVLVAAFFYVPQWLLSALPVASRTGRVWLATLWVLVAFAGAARAGWRLSAQRREADAR